MGLDLSRLAEMSREDLAALVEAMQASQEQRSVIQARTARGAAREMFDGLVIPHLARDRWLLCKRLTSASIHNLVARGGCGVVGLRLHELGVDDEFVVDTVHCTVAAGDRTFQLYRGEGNSLDYYLEEIK